MALSFGILKMCATFSRPGITVSGSGREEQDTHVQGPFYLGTIKLTRGLFALSHTVHKIGVFTRSPKYERSSPGNTEGAAF
jgi:hypothetical protein